MVCQKGMYFEQMDPRMLRGYRIIIFRRTKRTSAKTNSICRILINAFPVGMPCYWYADRVTSAHPISCHKQVWSMLQLNNQNPKTGCWSRHSKPTCIIYSLLLFTQKHNNPHRFGALGGREGPVSAAGSMVFAVFRKEKNSIVLRK